METTLEKTAIHTLLNMYDWHTKLFKNVLESITEEDAQNRLNTRANHMAWIAGSLVYGRYSLAQFFHINPEQQSLDLFKDFKGIQDNTTYPTLAEFKTDWDNISPALRNAILTAGPEQLNGPDPFKMPGENLTFLDTITACLDRESYCIGQLGLWRRLLNYEAMKYE
ncbi:DinB family protein [Pedobacter immunditicola]|uniref:DinB family protein n=1 Tax=Pedobacter immunditicola TaxID=3133440 RepID=UPI0030B37981